MNLPAQAIFLNNTFGSANFLNLETSNITQNTLFLYDQELEQYISIVNILNTGRLRIAILDKNYKTKKIFKPPETSSVGAFTIRNVSFYPSKAKVIRDEVKEGRLIFETNKGLLIVNLSKLESEFVQFGTEFFKNGETEIPVRQLTTPSFVK